MNSIMSLILDQQDYYFLNECLQLAEEALQAGDKPFGSILVSDKGEVIAKARNRVNEKNQLSHPEYELANWALDHLTPEERKKTVMYTTNEHCPMCAGAHAWANIGTVVYLSSGKQLGLWLKELNLPESPIHFLPIESIVKDIVVKGPAEGIWLEKIKNLHFQYYKNQQSK